MSGHAVEWLDGGREPECEPNPDYPNGCVIDCADNAMMHCKIELPYPAPRCGAYAIRCDKCGVSFALTAAGRVDDPKIVFLACYTGVDETTNIRKLPA